MPDSQSTNAGFSAPSDPIELIDAYFDRVGSGDPSVADLFSDDVVWRTPQSSPMAGPYIGKAAVLELMSGGVGLYDPSVPMKLRRDAIAANGEQVFVEMTITARTGQGEPYENHYVFVFTIRDLRITKYTSISTRSTRSESCLIRSASIPRLSNRVRTADPPGSAG